jgi:16S rRNA (guanine(966)-N(2))-methyltransferase RsmD
MASRRRTKNDPESPTHAATDEVGRIRIIGGSFRGRSWTFKPDPRIRPMKDRLREALFNLLGPSVRGTHAVDLFAGTGALGFEALSRGAHRATFIERHVPTARLLRESARLLEVDDVSNIVASDTFVWAKRRPDLGTEPVTAFCSPPYEFYSSRRADMIALLAFLLENSPPGSRIVAEFDERFALELLPGSEGWRGRSYGGINLAISEPTGSA